MVLGLLCGLPAAFGVGYLFRGLRELDARLKANLIGVAS